MDRHGPSRTISDHHGQSSSDLLPAAVFPVHDPQGWMLEHRRAMTPQLKALFSRVVELCRGEQQLHLCFEHRLACGLRSEHRAALLYGNCVDIRSEDG